MTMNTEEEVQYIAMKDMLEKVRVALGVKWEDEIPAELDAQSRKIKRLEGLIREAYRDFHGKSVLFSAPFIAAALAPQEEK
jgi:hypothetical protein